MKVAIIGAGIAGLTAAYELADEGHQVIVYEAQPHVGGLASGFRDSRWEWPLERFYHHIFETDNAIRSFAEEVNYDQKLFFRKGVTAHWWNGKLYPLDGPVEVLRFPGIPFADRVRFGFASFYLKYITTDWRSLEQTTAEEWTRTWMGEAAYRTIMQPLLEGKFGPYTPDVNMAWLWARLRARSFQLGYFEGGFQRFADAILFALQQLGGIVYRNTPVRAVRPREGGWTIVIDDDEHHYDKVIVTGSPALLSKLVPSLPEEYLGQIATLKSLGAVALVFALKHQLTKRFYWMQGMRKEEYPFLALVEHTNFIDSAYYGGDHLVYCGDYLPADHDYFRMSVDELVDQFFPAMQKFNPKATRDWIRNVWLQREPYAQPIVGLNHSEKIPPLETPLGGLYWASMSQVYPWDRGTNYAVELGQRVAAAAQGLPYDQDI
jgi:protoporphyrinogen oxidase